MLLEKLILFFKNRFYLRKVFPSSETKRKSLKCFPLVKWRKRQIFHLSVVSLVSGYIQIEMVCFNKTLGLATPLITEYTCNLGAAATRL